MTGDMFDGLWVGLVWLGAILFCSGVTFGYFALPALVNLIAGHIR